jgi:hypothetical protein
MRYAHGKHDEHQRPAATQTIESVADTKIPRRSVPTLSQEFKSDRLFRPFRNTREDEDLEDLFHGTTHRKEKISNSGE